MIGPIARILLRYISGALVTYGIFSAETGTQIAADPDLVLLIGAGIGGITEIGYVIAKRMGWAT